MKKLKQKSIIKVRKTTTSNNLLPVTQHPIPVVPVNYFGDKP